MSKNHKGHDAWVRFSLACSNGVYLIFSDTRKFGRVYFSEDLRELEDKLGPEPLTLPLKSWPELFKESRKTLKAFLLDQKKIAGIGNIYADESLFSAKLHPLKPANALSERETLLLAKKIKQILQQAIMYEGATISWYRKPDGSQGESQKHFNVYGKAGKPCPRCQTILLKISVSQRTTTFCSACQIL